jgi:hypothetical protein
MQGRMQKKLYPEYRNKKRFLGLERTWEKSSSG